MKLTVKVTEQDIDDGLGGNVASCPIALATTRALCSAGFRNLRATWEHVRAFCAPEGLVVEHRYLPDDPVCQVGVGDCPDEMSKFASMFDDWYERQCMDADDPEYLDQDGLPYDRPAPIEFVVELPAWDAPNA